MAIAESACCGPSKFEETFSYSQSGCAFSFRFLDRCNNLLTDGVPVGHSYGVFGNHTRNARTVGLQNLELTIFPQRSDTPKLSLFLVFRAASLGKFEGLLNKRSVCAIHSS
jgi:hypothetical protein